MATQAFAHHNKISRRAMANCEGKGESFVAYVY